MAVPRDVNDLGVHPSYCGEQTSWYCFPFLEVFNYSHETEELSGVFLVFFFGEFTIQTLQLVMRKQGVFDRGRG